MRITIINGQNHKGSTYHIGKMLVDKIDNISGPNIVSEFFLPRDFDTFCYGCNKCIVEDERLCPAYDKLKPITKAIDECDLLIFTTPCYVYHCTGQMKTLLDHYGYRWMLHRPEKSMFKRQAVVISTAAGGGMKSACKDIIHSLNFWGVAKIYKIPMAVASISWEKISSQKMVKIEKYTDDVATKVIKNNGCLNGNYRSKCMFYLFKRLQKKEGWNPVDREYWMKQGWNGNVKPWDDKSAQETNKKLYNDK